MQLDRMVVGIDFGEPSVRAAHWLARHFAPSAELMLVHAVEIPAPPAFLEGNFPPREEMIENAREGALQRLHSLRDSLGAPAVWTEVRVGSPRACIAEVAREFDAGLVAVGEHGRRPGPWNLLGSTAERLVQESPVPVLLARALPGDEPRRILVPVDDSPGSREALRWARFLVRRSGADVIALYAIDRYPLHLIRLVSSDTAARRAEAQSREQAAAWLRRQVEAAGFEEGAVRIRIEMGEPRYEILAAVERYDAELIIMASRRAGTLGGTVLGSVTRSVLRHANCPVLVVPADAD